MKDLFVQVSVTVVLVTLLPVISRASGWGNHQDYDQEENEFEDDYADTKWTKSKSSKNSNTKIVSRGNGNGCQGEGFQPNPSDCTKFIRCVSQGGSSYTRYDFDCGPGTVFDENLKLCNHGWALSRSSPCYKGSGSGSGSGSGFGSHQPGSIHGSNQGQAQHKNPSLYQAPQQSWRSPSQNQNQWRQPMVRVASSVSAVSVQSSVSSKDSSDSSSQEDTSPQPSENENEVTPTTTTEPTNGNNNETGVQPEGEINLECPNAGTFPHPKNCSKFFRCVEYSSGSGSGGAEPTYVIFQYGCSPGEIFDVTLEKCNLIQNVQRAGPGCAIDIQPPGAETNNNNNNVENQERAGGNRRKGYEYSAGPFKLSLGISSGSGSGSESTTPLPNGLSPPKENEENKTPEQLSMESSPACPAMIALPKDKDNGGDDNSTLHVFVSSLSPPVESEDSMTTTTSTTTTTTTTTTTPTPSSRIRGGKTKSTTTTTTTTTATPEVESPPDEPEMALTCGRGGSSRKLRANPFDCSKYYSCSYLGDSFVIKVRQCPPGHSFVQEEQRCQESSPDSDSKSCGAMENGAPEQLTRSDSDLLTNSNSSVSGNNTENSNSTGTLGNSEESTTANSTANSTDTSSTTAEPITELINADNSCPSEGNFGIPSDCFRFYNCRYSGPHLTSLLMKCPRGFYFVQGLCRRSSANSREEVTCSQQNVQSDALQSDGGDDDEAENILQNLGIVVPRKLYHLFVEQEQDQGQGQSQGQT